MSTVTQDAKNAAQPIVRCRGVSKRYGSYQALQPLDLDIPEGQVFGFLGPNGAGKTTLIRMILGLAAPTTGEIEIFGKDLFSNRHTIMRQVGAVVEAPVFFDYMTAWDNLRHLVAMSGKVSHDDLRGALHTVGLEAATHKKVGAFSYGMKQRLGIAQALLPDSRFLVLDEPTNGLDPHGIAGVRGLVRTLSAERGLTVFVSSHMLSEVEQICDRVMIINRGAKVLEGRVDDLRRTVGDVTVRLPSPAYLSDLGCLGTGAGAAAGATAGAAAGATGAAPSPATTTPADATILMHPLPVALPPGTPPPDSQALDPESGDLLLHYTLATEAVPELVRGLVAAGLPILAVTPRARTLEDIFLETTGDPDDVRVDSFRA